MSAVARLFDRTGIAAARAHYEECRYVALRSLLQPGLTQMLCAHIQAQAAAGVLRQPSRAGRERSLESSGDPLMERLLCVMTPQIEELIGAKLFPTYAFMRIYRTGERLAPHIDRPSCEVSLSVNLGQECDQPWPLWIEGACGPSAAELATGDAVLYRGMECRHWRETFQGTEYVQLFLHYVEQTGPHASLKFDGRASLGDQNAEPA